MRVAEWMTPKPFTLAPTDSIASAIAVMKEKKIRRIPIVSDGKLVGIVSDRDLKDVSPSRATTLDIWELHYVLDRMKLSDIMTRKVWTVPPEMPIEKAALKMMEKKVEGLPVVDGRGTLLGIVTEGDVFRALVELTGVGRKRTRIGLVIPDKPGTIREVADLCRGEGGTIFSIFSSTARMPAGKRGLVVRVEAAAAEPLRAVLSKRFGQVSVEAD
jgi:acetoin utilization protein AcuB